MAEAFIDVIVQLAFVSQRVGKTIPQVSLFAFFIGFSLATGSLAETAAVAPKKTIVFLGDSITAGYGLAKGDAYPALIQKKIEEAGLPYEVENAGLSGDTTAGALRRIDWLLQRPIHVLVIELGGNDGLRGLPPGVTEANLQSIIDKVRARSPLTRIMIAGMRIPPNLGADYTGRVRAGLLRSGDEEWSSARPVSARGCWRQSRSQPAGSNPSDCRRAEDHRRDGVEEVAAIVADEMNCWRMRAPSRSM